MVASAATVVPASLVARRHDIEVVDTLRGLAALGVVVFHARVPLWVGWNAIHGDAGHYTAMDRAAAWLAAPAPFLGSLVMLFFVVSGFCVHEPVAGRAGPFDARRFFTRRVLRIYPPYLGAVLLSFAVIEILNLPGLSRGRMVATALMAQNYTAEWVDSAAACQPASNPALWSLPVELELYLVYPIFWWLVHGWGWRVGLAIVGSVSVMALASFHVGLRFLDGNFAMYWLIWCAGAWLRERLAAGELGAPPAALTLLAVASLPLAAWLTMRAVGGATSLVWGGIYFWAVWMALAFARRTRGAERNGLLAHVLSALGRWSYSLYLLHFPLLLMLGAWWVGRSGAKPSSYLVCLGGCVAILPAVWIFYRLVERPSHLWARRAATKRPAAPAAVVT